ncbi:hypothetical protein MMPV_006061 [Pyropia vietnamensis]
MAAAADSVGPDGSSAAAATAAAATSPASLAASPPASVAAPRPRVTVLSGFLGSGKTTVLRHLLTAAPADQRVAVVVNDMAEINIDAALIRRVSPAAPAGAVTKSAGSSSGAANGLVGGSPDASKGSASVPPPTMVELQNGCICCTLRDDLVTHLTALARMSPPFDAILVESTGVAEPRPVAESFQFEVDPAPPADDTSAATTPSRRHRDAPQVALNDIAPLDTLVTVVDVSVFGEMLATTDAPVDRWGPSGAAAAGSVADGNTEAGTPAASAAAAAAEAEEYRPLSQLLIEQVEYANVIILNKTDLVSAAATAVVRAQVRALNRRAVVVEASHGRVPFGQVVATHAFDDSTVRGGAGWLVEMRAGGNDGAGASSSSPGGAAPASTAAATNGTTADAGTVAVRSELEEYNLSSFVYRRRRPFHPTRLAVALDTLCSMGEAVLRAKGFVWVATRHEQFGELSKAGATWALGLGGTWLVMDPYFQNLAARRFGGPVPAHVAATTGPDARPSTKNATTAEPSGTTNNGAVDKKAAAVAGEEPNGAEEPHGAEEEDEFATAALGDFDPALGDRRQEVVLIGRGMSRSEVERVLDAALLSDHEFAMGSRQWALLPDGLDSWSDGDSDGDSDSENNDASGGDDSGSDESDGDSGSEAADGRDKGATLALAGGDVKGCADAGCTIPHKNGKRALAGAIDADVGNVEASESKRSKQ